MRHEPSPAMPVRSGAALDAPRHSGGFALLAETLRGAALWCGDARLVATGLQPAPEEQQGRGVAPKPCRLAVRPESVRLRLCGQDRDVTGTREGER